MQPSNNEYVPSLVSPWESQTTQSLEDPSQLHRHFTPHIPSPGPVKNQAPSLHHAVTNCLCHFSLSTSTSPPPSLSLSVPQDSALPREIIDSPWSTVLRLTFATLAGYFAALRRRVVKVRHVVGLSRCGRVCVGSH